MDKSFSQYSLYYQFFLLIRGNALVWPIFLS